MIKYFLVVPHNPQTRKGILRKTDKIEEEKKDMATNTATLKKDIFIINSLITKDFKIKYRRSVLGILWSVLNPLLMMIIVAAVFSYILRGDDSIPCFPMYLILGQVLFNYMASATGSGMGSILGSAGLIKKIRVNKIIFPVQRVLFELINFAISLIAVVLVWIYYRHSVPVTPNVIFLPLVVFYVTLFSTGLAFILSAAAVFFRDVLHIWGVIITAWTYGTPIFYPISWLSPELATLMQFNPMYQYITYLREIILYGNTPSMSLNLVCLAIGVVTFFVGLAVFNHSQRKFINYI